MAWEMRDMSGSLFKNEKKQPGDNLPNATGRVMVNGQEYFCSAWTNESKSGGKYQSLSFQRVEAKQQQDEPDPF